MYCIHFIHSKSSFVLYEWLEISSGLDTSERRQHDFSTIYKQNKYLLWSSYLQLQFDHKGDFQGGRCMQCMCLKICISLTTNSNVFVLFSTIVKFARVLDCLHNYIEKYILPLHQYKLFNLQVKIIEQSWEKQQNFTLLKQISNFIKTWYLKFIIIKKSYKIQIWDF